MKMKKCDMFMVGLFALMVFFLGNINIASAGVAKASNIKFKITDIGYVDASTVMVKGWFYNTGNKGGIVTAIMYQLNAREEDGNVIFKSNGNRFEWIQPARVPMGSQSDPCTILLSNEDIRYYDGEVDWACFIIPAAVNDMK